MTVDRSVSKGKEHKKYEFSEQGIYCAHTKHGVLLQAPWVLEISIMVIPLKKHWIKPHGLQAMYLNCHCGQATDEQKANVRVTEAY